VWLTDSMNWIRSVIFSAVLVSAGFAVSGASAAPSHDATGPCTSAALTEGYVHAAGGTSVPSFQLSQWGCVGGYAYGWATVGQGPRAISVTEVWIWIDNQRRWGIAQRMWACQDTLLPRTIYRLGCFSN
jgi:hypothetical protein